MLRFIIKASTLSSTLPSHIGCLLANTEERQDLRELRREYQVDSQFCTLVTAEGIICRVTKELLSLVSGHPIPMKPHFSDDAIRKVLQSPDPLQKSANRSL